MIIEKQIDRHWSKAREIIADFDSYGGGPESDEEDAYDELDKMRQLLENNEVAWAVRKKVLDEMLEFVASDNSGFTDYLVDIAVDMCARTRRRRYIWRIFWHKMEVPITANLHQSFIGNAGKMQNSWKTKWHVWNMRQIIWSLPTTIRSRAIKSWQ